MAKLYHVVMQEATVTFLDQRSQVEFVANGAMVNPGNRSVLCESDVDDDQYRRIERWSKEGTDADV